MSDGSPDTPSGRDESGRVADLTPEPESATAESLTAEPRLAAPTGAPAQSEPSAGQWPLSPPTGGFGAPDPGAFQAPFGAPPAGGFQAPFGAPPAGAYPGGFPEATQRPSRRMRGPLIGFLAGAVAVALAVGGYAIASNLSNSANKPISTSVHAKSAGITVSGHGIQLAFPAGWQNVPTSPNQLRQFINDFAAKYHHIPSQLESEADNSQVLSTFAMLVFHFNAQGDATVSLTAIVEPGEVSQSEMIATLRTNQGPTEFGATHIQYSATTFGKYPGVIVTYSLQAGSITVYGAQSYLQGPSKVVITTVTSQSAATSKADVRQIVDTIKFL
jgi:hypothetical protein